VYLGKALGITLLVGLVEIQRLRLISETSGTLLTETIFQMTLMRSAITGMFRRVNGLNKKKNEYR
jgi:hypothetical protein